MADNIAITAGAGTTVSTEQLTSLNGSAVATSEHVQRIIIAVRTSDGTVVDVTSADAWPTEIVAGSVSLTGDITITADAEVVQMTPTISTSAYAAGDVIGGRQTISNVFRESGRAAVLQSLTVVDKDNEKAALEFYFFSSIPTISVDNAAFAWNSADYAKCLGKVLVEATDYTTVGGDAVATVYPGLVLYGNGTSGLYCAIVSTGAPTYSTTSDLIISLGLVRD